MAEGDGYKHFMHNACRYDMKDFLLSVYEPEKRPKASKPSVASLSHVLAMYKDSPEDEETSNHDQGSDSNDNDNIEVNHNGKT